MTYDGIRAYAIDQSRSEGCVIGVGHVQLPANQDLQLHLDVGTRYHINSGVSALG